MYQHRLVPEGAITKMQIAEFNFISESDTIPCPSHWTAEQLVVLVGITKGELNDIYLAYKNIPTTVFYGQGITFDEFFSDLLSLAPLKGLTVAEMKELNDR